MMNHHVIILLFESPFMELFFSTLSLRQSVINLSSGLKRTQDGMVTS